jgi:hypothetical protein
MLSQQEETEIYRGVDEILFNLQHLDVQDVAYFLVKYDQDLAERLATALEFNIFDKDSKNNATNS